ncbi:MAG: S-adenosyl-l-methionine hydroxide adenosyltransferase family protein [Dehalococcoidia bacterium]
MTRPIFLLTDFGTRDSFAGQMRAVMASVAPGVAVYDLTHEVEPFAIDEGVWQLDVALDALPEDAVVCAVVDPGVGSGRRALCVERDSRTLIGPDNGLLSAGYAEETRGRADAGGSVVALGSADRATELCSPQYWAPRTSATFHGRDIFAPVAAHVAKGVDSKVLGTPVAEAVVFPACCGQPAAAARELHGYVVHVDRFGNLITTVRAAQLFPLFEIRIGGLVVDQRVRTFANSVEGVPFCYADSSGYLAIAINRASAAAALGIGRGEPVAVVPR